jgi:hypothetical protein
MSLESRVRFLHRAAERAEREGNVHLAAVLRKMADELKPADGPITGMPVPPTPA